MDAVRGFDRSFDRLIDNEGGYVNDPADPGGETHWGVTWPKLREAVAAGVPGIDGTTTILGLTRDQARAIYRQLFWDASQMDRVDPAVAFQAFDAEVNHGLGTGVRLLQRAAGVADDGRLGPVSLAAIGKIRVPTLLITMAAERLDYYTRLSGWDHDGRGWARRIVADLRWAARDEAQEAAT